MRSLGYLLEVGQRLAKDKTLPMGPRAAGLIVLAVLVSLGAVSTSSDDEVAKDEIRRHQGIWTVVSSVHDGQAAPADVVRSIKRIVTDEHAVWERDGKRFAGTTFQVRPEKQPKAIDVIPDGGPNRGEPVLGIYKLDGDTLTICMAGPGAPRPKDWTADKGSGCTLRVFKREPPGASRSQIKSPRS